MIIVILELIIYYQAQMHMIKQEILPLFPLFYPIGYTEKGNWRTAYYSFLSKSQYHLIAFSQDSIGVTEKKYHLH